MDYLYLKIKKRWGENIGIRMNYKKKRDRKADRQKARKKTEKIGLNIYVINYIQNLFNKFNEKKKKLYFPLSTEEYLSLLFFLGISYSFKKF